MDIIPLAEIRQEPMVNIPGDYDPSLNGVGGFLGFVILGRIVTIIMCIIDIPQCFSLLGLRSDLDVFLYLGIAIDIIAGIAGSIVILIFMFSRNIAFRTLFVIQVCIILFLDIAMLSYFSGLGYDLSSTLTTDLIRSLVVGGIWILYLYKSKRIKNTYIYYKYYSTPIENINTVSSI
jgi:hypothetical protein